MGENSVVAQVGNAIAPNMTSGGGNFFENIISDAVNGIVRVSTGGDMGFEDGKFTGTPFHALNETIGEVTGRNVQRKALMNQQDAVAEEKAAKLKEIADNNERARAQDVSTSRSAAAIRASATARGNMIGGNSMLGRSDASTDFLGL